MKERLKHLIVQVATVEIVAPYTLRVQFNDGKTETIDFQRVLGGYYYAPLRDLGFFNQVQIDPEVHTLVWPNGADFDPATLYNWNEGEGKELADKVASWKQTAFS